MARIPYNPYDQELNDQATGPGSWNRPFGSLYKDQREAEPANPKAAADVVYGNMNSPDRGQAQPSESFFAVAKQEKQAIWVDDFYPSMRKQQPKRTEPATQPSDRTADYRAAPNQYASLAGPQGSAVPDRSPEGPILAKARGGKTPAPKPAPARRVSPTPALSPAPVKKPASTPEPETAVNPAFLTKIWNLESNGKSEEEATRALGENKAAGKYQLTRIALR